MKPSSLLLLFFAYFSFASFPQQISAQTEFGARLLFFQIDLRSQSGTDVGQGPHAGEWQAGVSVRKYFSRRFVGRLESNLTWGRYRLAGNGKYYWFNGKRFLYLGLCAIPEWRVSQTISIGAGGFVNQSLIDPHDTQKNIEAGALANLSLRYGPFEIQCRFQQWLAPSGKITMGAGLDYYFGKKKTSQEKGSK